MQIGLIVNPIAGIGGRVGLKGSDGVEIQQQAIALGGSSQALQRSVAALKSLAPLKGLKLITYPGEMGEDAARTAGIQPKVIGHIIPGATTAEDTHRAAQDMQAMGVDLLLFAGGDGTARDIFQAVGDHLPVLGIPAGVKIQSAVFSTHAHKAGELAHLFLAGRLTRLRHGEVIDLDETAVRRGEVLPRLYGYLLIPYRQSLLQGSKIPSSAGEAQAMAAIAQNVIERMSDDVLYIIGPGTTTRAITDALGLEKTLIGVDVLAAGTIHVQDANESQLLSLPEGNRTQIIVTPIGGQGYLFGRGNQQLSAKVINRVGCENILVVATEQKIHSLGGRPLLVDTGNRETDEMVAGYVRVITGYHEETMYRVAC